MLYQIQAASVEELREAYQDCLLRQRAAELQGKSILSQRLRAESEVWRVNFIERMEQLSASITNSSGDSRTDGGKQ